MRKKKLLKRILGWGLLIHVIPIIFITVILLSDRYNNYSLLERIGAGLIIGYIYNLILGLIIGTCKFIIWLITCDE